MSIHSRSLFLIGLLFLSLNANYAQNAHITEESRSLKTYAFDNPNPIPILSSNPKIYPYFSFEGYSTEGQPQDWKVVKLENDYVEVYVLPEVGGKVWGAIEKSTGEEFIYRNEVMKFRNISMRGPWTSGGIEFNFGIIGHHPSTATPVDYVIQEHEDGSVSCTVGNIDLPSRTQWRVTIVLPKDKALFETRALWYNPTPMHQSYYNWMTGAAPARQDFEFYTPGDEYLKHSGQAMPWPLDDRGRNIALYKENNFGPHKSYHVVGEYNDFFGGYYHEANYGFGHWGEYEETPGQKLWLWALSRNGGIWEDLLTDTDGQYIEFQAGRLFVQYSAGAHNNPITEANFEPYSTDQWREVWFPIKQIGGISDASESAVMNVAEKDGQLQISLNPFQQTKATLEVSADDNIILTESLNLAPMAVYSKSLDLAGATDYEINIDALDLHYSSKPEINLIERPFHSGNWPAVYHSAEKTYRAGLENMKFRHFSQAKDKFEQALSEEPYHAGAMVGLGELYYRRGEYAKGLSYANQALRLDTYNPHANYTAGILYRAKGDLLNAKESLGWAARSMQYRSNAYAQMAEILLAEEDWKKAEKYAQKAIDFNRYNLNAWQVMAIAARKLNDPTHAQKAISEIMQIDPLNHFGYFEQYLGSKAGKDKARFVHAHRSELAYQTFLELAIDYHNKGLNAEAIGVLELAPQHPLVNLWKSYLQEEASTPSFKSIENLSPELVFPFRRESLEALAWANEHSKHWKLTYYLALNLWGKDRLQEAAKLMQSIGEQADYGPFYMARADLLQKTNQIDPLADLQKAHALDQTDWRTWRALTAYHKGQNNKTETLEMAHKAYQQFPDNYATGMDYAEALNQSRKYEESLKVLNKLDLLPFEGASQGRVLYQQANIGAAISQMEQKQYKAGIELLEQSKLWPEQLGVGKPYNPDERIADYLLALSYAKLNNKKSAQAHWQKVVAFSQANVSQVSALHLLGLKALYKLEGAASATAFLESLLRTHHGGSPVTQWVAASYLGNMTQQQASMQEGSDQMKLLGEIVKIE